MPVIVNQIISPLGCGEDEVVERAIKALGVKRSEVLQAGIYKVSLDARKRNDIHFVHSVMLTLSSAKREKKLCENDPRFSLAAESRFEPVKGHQAADGRIVVAGFGPAGMFCALALAEQGYRPLVIERGAAVDERAARVKAFWQGGELDENTNVQFGEGGAGTFSDGKLTTRIRDPLCRYVLERMRDFGAPEEILTKAKPHIGTDNLRGIVKAIRERITELGGEVRFNTALSDIEFSGRRIVSVTLGGEKIKAAAVVLAIGHSARDTFEMLFNKGIFLEAKPFSVGARIEHRQEDVNYSLYGEHMHDPLLPVGEYQLSCRDKNGRSAYTFCMCPGGVVVPAASEKGGVVTNGMSEFARDGSNANAALVVSVTPEDLGTGALDGMRFARKIEQAAFAQSGGYKACGTTVKGFLNDKPDLGSALSPTYALGLCEADYRRIFPPFVTDMMKAGLRDFGRKMACFKDGSALLSAPETRTSSPVRISRSAESFTSLTCDDLYPCGEGAGYAGGIMSAAVDGLNTAIKITGRFSP